MANIKGITIEIDGKTTGLEKSLSNVNSEAVKTQKELSSINKALKFNPGNAELVAQKQQLLAKQISNTSEKLKQLKDAEAEVKAQVASGKIGEDKYRAFQREVIETESKLKTYQQQLKNVATEQETFGKNTKRLETYFKATKTSVDDYEDVLGQKLVQSIKNGTASSKDLETALNKIAKESVESKDDIVKLKQALDSVDDGNSIENVTKELDELSRTSTSTSDKVEQVSKSVNQTKLLAASQAISDAGNKVKEFAGKSQDAFREYDAGLDIITTKTGKSSDFFQEQFDNIYSSMAIDDTSVLGSAIGEINTQLDFTGDKLEQASRQALMYAQINNVDVSQSIMSAKSALEAYELTNDDFNSVLDAVTATSQRTGVSVDALMSSAIAGAPQIKALGLNFAEGVEVLGQFEKAGVDGTATLSSLSKASVIYAKDGLTLQQGLAVTIDKIKNAKSETEALTEANKIFGAKGANKMVDAIKRGALSFDDLSKAAKESQGVVSDTFALTVDDMDTQQIAMQQLNKVMAEFGAEIGSALKPILEAIIPVIRDIATWFRDLPEPVKQTIVVIGGLLAGLATLMPLFTSLAIVGPALIAGITALGAVLAPFAGIIAIIVGAVVGAIAIFTNWDTIVKALGDTWNWLAGFAGTLWEGLTTSVGDFVDGAGQKLSEFGTFMTDLWTGISTTAGDVWEGVKTTASNAINGAKDAVNTAIEAIKGFLKFEWKWPKIPIPHFTFSGSLNPLDWGDASKRPNIGVEWYAKGGILRRPTVFGVNGNNLMVGGEAGNEAVLPLNKDTLGGIGAGIAQTMQSNDGLLLEVIDLLQRILDKDTDVYLDGDAVTSKLSPKFSSYNNIMASRNRRLVGG